MLKYTVTQAAASLDVLIEQVQTGKPVVLTRDGNEVAVVLSFSHYGELTSKPSDFWSLYQVFLETADLAALNVTDDTFDVRSRDVGRTADF